MSTGATPAFLHARLTDAAGRTWFLGLVRGLDKREGFAVLEVDEPGSGISINEPCAWIKRSTDDGPCVLSLELRAEPIEDIDGHEHAINVLLGELVESGASWGFEAASRWS